MDRDEYTRLQRARFYDGKLVRQRLAALTKFRIKSPS
jgi:hypothetical protein